MTREERFDIYRKMLVLAEEDLEYSQKRGYFLFGFCSIIENINWELDIKDFPELMKYKPEDAGGYWFDTDPDRPDATKRIDILKEILSNEHTI
jgi:hypothetical protein